MSRPPAVHLLLFLASWPSLTHSVEDCQDLKGRTVTMIHSNDLKAAYWPVERDGRACPHPTASTTSRQGSTAAPEDPKCFGGFSRLAHLIKLVKSGEPLPGRDDAPPHRGMDLTIHVNTGNNLLGSGWGVLFREEVAVDLLKRLQIDVVALGPDDLDVTNEEFLQYLNKMSEAEIPVVACNLKYYDRSQPPLIKTHHIIEEGDIKIGIVGFVPKRWERELGLNLWGKKHSLEDPQWVLEDERTCLRQLSIKLDEEENVNLMIALSSQGFDQDKRMAVNDLRTISRYDMLVGGNSRTLLYGYQDFEVLPEVEFTAPDPEDRIEDEYPKESGHIPFYPFVITCYEHGKYFCAIDWCMITHEDAQEMHLKCQEGMTEVKGRKILCVYQKKHQPVLVTADIPTDDDMEGVLGDLSAKIPSNFYDTLIKVPFAPYDHGPCSYQQCTLGELATDSIENIETDTDQQIQSKCRVAGVPAGAIRAPLRGEVRLIDVYRTYPQNGEVKTFTKDGIDLEKIIEDSVGLAKKPPFIQGKGFLQLSRRFRIWFELDRPKEDRLSSLHFCGNCVPEGGVDSTLWQKGTKRCIPLQPQREYYFNLPASVNEGQYMYSKKRDMQQVRSTAETKHLRDHVEHELRSLKARHIFWLNPAEETRMVEYIQPKGDWAWRIESPLNEEFNT